MITRNIFRRRDSYAWARAAQSALAVRASPETGDKPRRGRARVQKALVTRLRGDAEHLVGREFGATTLLLRLQRFCLSFAVCKCQRIGETKAACRRPSSRSSSSRSCASRARSRPRPRCCWRRRRRHRRGACRRRRRTPTCCPRWRCRRARCRDRRRTPRGRRTPRCRGRRVGTACHRPSFYLEATTPRRHRGRRFLGTRLNATRRRGRRDTRTARRRRALGRILGRGRRTTRARRRGLLSESLPAKFWIRMLLCHQSTRV